MRYLIGIKSMQMVGKVVSCLAAGAWFSFASMQANADMIVEVQGYDPVVIEFPAMVQNGTYSGEHLSGDGAWKLTWNLAVDPTATGNAVINGNTDLINNTSAPLSVDILVDVPVKDDLINAAMQSTVVLKAITNADGGGLLSNSNSSAIWSLRIDEAPALSAFYSPFQMLTTGSGSLSTSSSQGAPLGSLAAPDVTDSIGFEAHYSITAGDRAIINNLVALTGTVVPDVIPPTPTPTSVPGGENQGSGEVINPEGGNGEVIPSPTPTPGSGGGEIVNPPEVPVAPPQNPVIGEPENGDGGEGGGSDPQPAYQLSFSGKAKKSPNLFDDKGTVVLSSSGLTSDTPVTIRAEMGKLKCDLKSLSVSGNYIRSMQLSRKAELASWAGNLKLVLLDSDRQEIASTQAKARKVKSASARRMSAKAAKKLSCSMMRLK